MELPFLSVRIMSVLALAWTVLLTVSFLSSGANGYNITHKPGYCIWYGECARSPVGYYNCFYNGPARKFYDDPEFFDLVKEVCPMFINITNPESSAICCDKAQVKYVSAATKVAEGLFQHCPACAQNFLRLFCKINCDPNMSVWFDIPPGSIGALNVTTWYVREVNAYVTLHFAVSLYNSCSNVRYVGTSTKVVDLMCYGVDKCNATLWLHFLGDNEQNPFRINFIINDTVKGHPDFKPNNHTFFPCNTTNLGLQCSCTDCPAQNTCPVIPAANLSWYRYIHTDISRAIWCVGTAISVAVFILALICALSKWSGKTSNLKLHTQSLDHNTAGDCSQPQASQPPDNIPSKSGAHSSMQFRHTHCSTGSVIQRMFYHWGCFCADHPFLVLIFATLPSIFYVHGLFQLQTSFDPVELWSQPNSQSRQEMAYFEKNFGPLDRTEQLIINAKPNIPGYQFLPIGSVSKWHFSPIFQMKVLSEVYFLQKNLSTMNVTYTPKGGVPQNISLSDICYKPDKTDCEIESLLNYFQNNYTRLVNTTYDVFGTVTYNASYHLHYCVRNPSAAHGLYVFYPCLAAFRGPIDPKVVLAGFEGDNYESAVAMVVRFTVDKYADVQMVEAWEKGFIKFMRSYQGKYINFVYSTERSLGDETDRANDIKVITIAISWCFMLLYVTVCLGYSSTASFKLGGLRMGVGLCGVTVVVLALASAMGFFGYDGSIFSPIALKLIQFLVLATGVDNIFVIVYFFQQQLKALGPNAPVREIIGNTLACAAPSLLLTSLSVVAGFMLGGLSPTPAVRTFSLCAGLALFVNLLLQLSAFIAVLSLYTNGKQKVNLLCMGRSCLSRLIERLATFVLCSLVRPFVLLVFGLILTASLAQLLHISVDLDPSTVLPPDSYLMAYYSGLKEHKVTGPPLYLVIKDGYNYSEWEKQKAVCSLRLCDHDSLGNQISGYSVISNYTHVASPAKVWLDWYLDWVSPLSSCCGIENETHTECYNPGHYPCVPCVREGGRPSVADFGAFLHWFLHDSSRESCTIGGYPEFEKAVKLTPDMKTVATSYIKTHHTTMMDASDYIAALKQARRLSTSISKTLNHTVFPFSPSYIYYDQYLDMDTQVVIGIAGGFASVLLLSVLLYQSLWTASIQVFSVACVIATVLGTLSILGVSANLVSLANVVVAIGVSVGFSSHVIYRFVNCPLPTRRERAHSALSNSGALVLLGIAVTKFIGMIFLAVTNSPLLKLYYLGTFMCTLFWGSLQSLTLLPVLLSYIGPPCSPSAGPTTNPVCPLCAGGTKKSPLGHTCDGPNE